MRDLWETLMVHKVCTQNPGIISWFLDYRQADDEMAVFAWNSLNSLMVNNWDFYLEITGWTQ